MEEEVGVARELLGELLERMGVKANVEGFFQEGNLHLEVKGDREGILIGKHGRTLESLQILVSRMVNKRIREPVRIVLDIDDYCKRKADTLTKMALRLGDKAKKRGHPLTIGPFNAHDRRLIHLALKEDPSIRTESLGEGELKKISIIPTRSKEEGRN